MGSNEMSSGSQTMTTNSGSGYAAAWGLPSVMMMIGSKGKVTSNISKNTLLAWR